MRARLSRILILLFSVALGLSSLWVLELSRLSTPSTIRDVAPHDARVVVYLVDSFAAQEATDATLWPKLRARIASQRSLSGPVRACADAVTVPCITAMLTGVDRFSIFALGRNFGGGALKGSLLEHLKARGRRVGYVGEIMLKNTFSGLDFLDLHSGKDDELNLQRSLDVLANRKLDMLIVHLRELDELSHRNGATTPEYRQRTTEIDAALDRTIAALPPTDHVIVLGDHGHTPEGRHFAGLEVPTYAAYFGPSLPHSFERPMAITDHATIMAHLFGLGFGARSWVDDYFEGKTVEVPKELPGLPSSDHTPFWGFVACTLLGLAALALSPARASLRGSRASVSAFAISLVLAIGLGLVWFRARPFISYIAFSVQVTIAVITGYLGARVLGPAVRRLPQLGRVDGWVLPLMGVLVFALPTIHKQGGPFVVFTWLGISIAWLAFEAFRAGDRKRALALAALWVPYYTIYNPAVRNFSVRWFFVYTEWLKGYGTQACAVWLMVAIAIAYRKRLSLGDVIGIGVGVALAAARGTLPAWVFVAPCALVVPACALALRRPELGQLALASGISALWYFFDGDGTALAPVAAVLVLWAGLPALISPRAPFARTVIVLTLVLASFWTSMGCRMTGVSFDFFFAWLPEGAVVTDSWALTTVFAVLKYLSVPMLGFVLATRQCGPALFESTRMLDTLVPARIAFVVAFLAAFSMVSPQAGPFITADIVQDATLWMIILFLLTLLPDRDAALALEEEPAVELASEQARAQAA